MLLNPLLDAADRGRAASAKRVQAAGSSTNSAQNSGLAQTASAQACLRSTSSDLQAVRRTGNSPRKRLMDLVEVGQLGARWRSMAARASASGSFGSAAVDFIVECEWL